MPDATPRAICYGSHHSQQSHLIEVIDPHSYTVCLCRYERYEYSMSNSERRRVSSVAEADRLLALQVLRHVNSAHLHETGIIEDRDALTIRLIDSLLQKNIGWVVRSITGFYNRVNEF